VKTSNPAALPVYGTCWLPVERLGWYFTGKSPSAKVLNWSSQNVHRYDTRRYAKNYTESIDPLTGQKPGYHTNWRNAIYDEVRARTGPAISPTPGSGSWSPGEPYSNANRTSTSVNRTAAAAAARDYARCEDGPLSSAAAPGDDPEPNPDGFPDVSVQLGLSAPQNFVVGGATARQAVSVTASDYTCTNCSSPGSPTPYVKELNVALSVGTTGGYTQWKTVQAHRKNLASVCSVGQLVAGCTTSKVLEFYRATRAGQTVQVSIAGSGTVWTFPNRKTAQVPVSSTCDRARPGCLITIVYYPPVERTISVSYATPQSAAAPVISSTATWRK
jgi:hypothetical protein